MPRRQLRSADIECAGPNAHQVQRTTPMANSNRAFLRQELSQRFIPHLQSKGFAVAKDAAKGNGRSSFPFGTFIREHGADADVIKIQFDKYSRPKFILNFSLRSGNDLVESFRLHPRPKSSAWFTMRTFFGLRSAETCARQVVDQLMNLFPEVESWFKDRVVGKHLRRLYPYP